MKIALIHNIIRGDEKLLIKAAKDLDIELQLINLSREIFNPQTYQANFDLVLNRAVSTTQGLYATLFYENLGIPVLNNHQVSTLCADKFATSLCLQQANVATLRFAMVFDEKTALDAIEQLGGFPVVLKPALGSWGRLLSKVNDQEALETIIEHKKVLGSPQHQAFYIQEYIEKPGRDIRAFVVGGKTIAAIYRDSPHWITNTARGGKASNCPITPELSDLCQKTSEAIGGGILAMDVFETDQGLMINEINHTMEFKNSEKPTGVSISQEIIKYCQEFSNDQS
jgi:[lysine-biosynthesis-protein LysW]---L-2-aminoadipate ligase